MKRIHIFLGTILLISIFREVRVYKLYRQFSEVIEDAETALDVANIQIISLLDCFTNLIDGNMDLDKAIEKWNIDTAFLHQVYGE